MPEGRIIAIVDDDEAVREAIKSLLRSLGFRVELFPSAESFLEAGQLRDTSCLILDVRMPGMGGLELRRRLAMSDCRIPIIFITAHTQEEILVRALRKDVVACLSKPFSEAVLLEAVHKALGIDGKNLFRGETETT